MAIVAGVRVNNTDLACGQVGWVGEIYGEQKRDGNGRSLLSRPAESINLLAIEAFEKP